VAQVTVTINAFMLEPTKEVGMSKIQRTVFWVILFSSLLFAVHAQAGDNTCRIVAGDQDDVWVIIYDADNDGNPGPIIWKGKIEAGKSIPITSTDGNIRIDYTMDPNQAYDGALQSGCYGQQTVLVDY